MLLVCACVFLEKIISPLSAGFDGLLLFMKWWGLVRFPSFMLTSHLVFSLCRSCLGTMCWDFMGMASLSCLEDSLSGHPDPKALRIVFALSSAVFLGS